jgi:hypothetical protein
MSDTPSVTQQYAFSVGEDGETDGIEAAEESVETSLEAFGADVDHRERDTRMDKPEATSFGVDDRPEVTSSDGGEQGALFADTTDDQQTLTGERAASQCLFESDEQDGDDHEDDDRADTPSGEDDESLGEPTDTSDEASPRAVATDGGRVEDPDSGFAVGTRVEDREQDDPNPAVVVARPGEPAYAREIDALDGKSVADVNPDYGASGPVATVAYADDLDGALDVWREADPDALAQICDDEGVRTYDFPTARLQEATMSDGGRGEDADNAEQTDGNEGVMVAIPRLKLASVADYVEYEQNTVERHAGEGPQTEELTQYVEECRSALSVLDDTDANGHISRVVAAGAADKLEQSAERHHGDVEQELRELVGVLRQALDEQPTSDGFEDDHNDEDDEPTDTDEQDANDRDDEHAEEADASPDEGEDTTFDADAETVTDAWEGAFLSASWGYEQTNAELAQIVEVSGSGKTVVARMVVAERVGHGRNSTQIRPTAEQYGDEFRLHVRSPNGKPAFRGSYPLSNDGDMDDGPTRRGSFYPFDNDPENSVRRTATNHGH